MNDNLLRTLARRGAEVRLIDLANERAALLEEFPDLAVLDEGVKTTTAAAVVAEAHERKRSTMTKGQRAAVSRRMKAYWKARRKEKP